MDKQQYAAALEKQYGKLSQSELSELIRDNERKINSAERPDIAAGYARQNQYLAKMYRSKSNSANNRKNDAKNNNSSGSSKSSSNSLSTSYSPLTGLKTVNEPISRMKNRTNSSGKKSGSATGGGKAAGRSPVVFGAYSPVAGVPDPLERLRNRISGGTKEAADSYRGGAARRRTNVPAAGKTVDPVTADYLSRISQLARTLEKHRLSSGSDFDKILSFNRVLARQEKEDRDNAYENALLKQFGSFSSSQLRERIEQNERAISAANRPDVAAGYERQNKILARWMLERQAKEKADSFLSLKNNADFKQTAAERKAGLLDSDFKYINNIDNERSKAKAARGLNAGISGARLDNLEQLTAEETEIYNYLHNTQGNRAAKEYLDYLEPDLNARRAKKDSARAKAFAKEHPHLSDVFSVLEAPARAVGSAAAVIDDIAGAANGKKVDVNSVYRAGSNAVGAAREVTNKKWEDKINVNLPVIGNLGSFLHGAVLSGLDSAMMMLTGGAVGGALGKTAQGAEAIAKAVVSVGLSSELASSEIVANKAKGYSDLRAVGLGLANGLTEALSEKFSLDVIMKGSPKGALAAMGRSFLAEGSEEAGATAANMAIDAMVNGSDSDIKKRIAEYKQAGEGDFGAVSKALADFIVPEFLAGGLSGSAMGGVHYGMSGKSQKAGGKNGVTFDDIIYIGKEGTNKNAAGVENGADNDLLFSINYDKNNVPFVEVDNDVLAGLTQKEKQAKVKEILKDRFSQGVSVGNEQIQITKKSRDEFLNSKYTNTLKRKQPSVYDDKLRSSDNLDEIVKASRDYVGEGLKHPRKDSIREFARGTVNLRVGGKDYSADVVVGTKSDDSLVFYDLINFKPAKINERAPVTRMVNKNDSTNSLDWNALSDSSIPQTTENYNPEMQKNSDENGPVYSVNPEGAEQRESQAPAMQENEAAGALGGGLMGGTHYGSSKLFGADGGRNKPAKGVTVFGQNSVKRGDRFDQIVRMNKEQGGTDSGILYSIRYDRNNVPFVEVEDDVLKGLSQKEKQARVKQILKDRFSQGVSVGNELIKVNAVSRNEILNSKYSQIQKNNKPDVYNDKLRVATQLDEIVKASRDFVGEKRKHPRKDSIREFARGTVNIRVGGKDYSADIIVGTKYDNSLVFYDLINLDETTIEPRTKKERPIAVMDGDMPTAPQNEGVPDERASDFSAFSAKSDASYLAQGQDTLSNNSISRFGGKYNPKTQETVSFGEAQGKNGDVFGQIVNMGKEQGESAQNEIGAKNDGRNGSVYSTSDAENGGSPFGAVHTNNSGGAELDFESFKKAARQLGFKVVDTPMDGILEDVDGYVDPGRREIYVNPDAQDPASVVMKHELTHILENGNSEYFNKAKDYLRQQFGEEWEQRRREILEKYIRINSRNPENAIEITDSLLDSETMAELSSYLATDEAIARFANGDQSVFRNISLWFSYMAKQIKAVFGDLTTAEKLEVAAYKWEQALRKAETRNVSENSGVIYLSANNERGLSIKKQLFENLDRIMQLPVVKRLTFDTNPTEGIAQLKNNLLKRIQNSRDGKKISVNREGFGTIQVGYSEIKSGLKYLSTKEEIASVDAILDVLKSGIQIYEKSNHKGRDYPTFTFGAPIELNGKPYGMAVVVKRTSENKYKVHRLLMPDGAALEFSDDFNVDTKTKATEATFTQMTAENDGESRAITSAANDSVSQSESSVNSNFMQDGGKDAGLKFLFAGEKSKTADSAALKKAKGLAVLNVPPEQIFRGTGYVQGLDGKWRFELDDSRMKFRKKDGKISDVLRINELNFRSMTEGLSDAESDEFLRLRQAASRGELSAPLSDVISYDLLFEAYPALKEVLVKSDYHAIGMGKAAFDPGTKTIYLSPQANGAKLRQTLLHEIQHAVQDEEGFSFGSSPDYWRERSGISAKEAERLYENTAGEIEARDVERRADLTEEERRETFPASAEPNDDVVFAGEETGNAFVLYHADSAESDAAGIISKLKEHLQDIARQPKVFHVKKNVLDGLGEKASEAIGNYFNSIGNKAVNPEIGVVELSKRGAKSTVFHGTSSEKLKAVGAIKDVIEKGTIFDFEKNWKNRGYDTYLIAANGTVMGQPRALGVVVKAYPGSNMNNKFYLHEVIEMELTHHLDAAADNGVTHVSKSTPIDSVSQGETSVNSYSMQTQENNAFDRILRMSGGSKEKRITFDDLLEA